MRLLLLAALLCSALWYYFSGGRKMDEEQIRVAYDHYWSAFYEDDRKAICDMFDKRFVATVRTRTPAGQVEEKATKSEACDSTKKFFDMKDAMAEKVGQQLFINTNHTIDSIELAADRKSATVEMHSEIRIGTEQHLFMKITETQTDTLVRHMGTVRFLSSDGDVSFY